MLLQKPSAHHPCCIAHALLTPDVCAIFDAGSFICKYSTVRWAGTVLLFIGFMPVRYLPYHCCLCQYEKHHESNIVLHQGYSGVLHAACVDAHLLP